MISRSYRFASSFAAILLASVSAATAQSSGKENILQQGTRTTAADDEWRTAEGWFFGPEVGLTWPI
jgi:hypothetical protein